MRNISKACISLLSLLCMSSKSNAYRVMDLNSNPFVCLNECDQDDHLHNKAPLRVETCDNTNPHFISALPYWDPTQAFPCMFAGTLNVSMTNSQDHNLFYWHFKNTSLTDAPLVVWINGGPGSTSMFGLFLENGPLQINKNGTGVDDFILGLNAAGSWVDLANMVFIDQPVGTGFSYGNSYLDRMEDGATEFVNFLVAFITMYPEYKNSPVILAGESYAGKYLPHFATKIDRHNGETHDNVPVGSQIFINLKAVLIGDPFVSPVRQRTSTHLVAQGLNVIDFSNMAQVSALRKRCEESISNDWKSGSEQCGKTMDYIDDQAGGLFTYDGSIFDYDWNPINDPVDYFLGNCSRRDELYKAIHIDKSTKSPVYEAGSDKVAEAYDFEEMLDWSSFYDSAIGICPILVYAGEFDQRDGPTTQVDWMSQLLRLDHADKVFYQQARKIYYYQDSQGAIQVGGYFRYDVDRQFTFLTIPKAGHFVPTTQLDNTKSILNDYITNGKLVCHQPNATLCETAPIMCQYMNNCNGNGVCQWNGRCQCNAGYKAADCSEKVEVLADGYTSTQKLNGTQWVYYQFNKNMNQQQYFEWTIKSQQSFTVYIIAGVNTEPTQFNNDLEFKDQNNLVISSQSFPALRRFTAAVRVNGVALNGNAYFQSDLISTFSVKSLTSAAEMFEYLEDTYPANYNGSQKVDQSHLGNEFRREVKPSTIEQLISKPVSFVTALYGSIKSFISN